MSESANISDEEISEIAKEVIRRIASRAKLSKEIAVREIDGQIEFLIESSDPIAAITFRPQKKVEEILRETEKSAYEQFKDVVPESELSLDVYRLLHQSDEDVEIRALIEKFHSTFNVAISKLDNGIKNLRLLAKKEVDKIERRYTRPTVKAANCMRFAEVVMQLKPLWDAIIDYAEKNAYQCDLSVLSSNEKYVLLPQQGENLTRMLRDVFKRQSLKGQERRKLEPLGFALRHAQMIVPIKGDHETLINCHLDGLKYLKDPGEFPST